MKRFIKVSALAVVLVASSTFVYADTIQLGSFATGASSLGNNNTATNFAGFNPTLPTVSAGVGNTFTLNPGTPVWGGPITNSTWVGSTATSGPVGTVNPAFGYYTFTTNFTAASTGPYSGSLGFLADDTAEVILNGSVLLPFGSLGPDAHCAASSDSCLGTDTITLTGISLLTGTDANTLTFVVQQAGTGPTGGTGDPSGLDFQGTLASAASAVPEPSTLMLIGTGLFGLAGTLYRRMRL
jgi:PEP-CTERM motif